MIIKSHFKVEFDYEIDMPNDTDIIQLKETLCLYFRTDAETMLEEAQHVSVNVVFDPEKKKTRVEGLRLDV